MGWVTPDELVDKSSGIVEKSTSYVGQASEYLFGGNAEEVKKMLPKSKVALSNVAKRMPGLVGGVAVGSLLGYRLG